MIFGLGLVFLHFAMHSSAVRVPVVLNLVWGTSGDHSSDLSPSAKIRIGREEEKREKKRSGKIGSELRKEITEWRLGAVRSG